MASRNSPHSVNRTSILRSLEQQNTGSFMVVRVVLNRFCCFHTFDKFPRKQSVSGNFVVSMIRNANTALGN